MDFSCLLDTIGEDHVYPYKDSLAKEEMPVFRAFRDEES